MIDELLDLARKKADQAEVFSLSVASTSVGFEADELRMMDSTQTSGCALRVISGGRLGFGVSSDASRAKDLVEKTVALAGFGEPVAYSFPAPADLPRLSLDSGGARSVSIDKMIETGRGIIARLKDFDPAVKAGAGFGKSEEKVGIANTSGFRGEYEVSTFGVSASAELVEEGNLLHVFDFYSGFGEPESYDPIILGCIEKMRACRVNVPFKSGKCRVILSPEAFADVLTAFVWYGASGSLAAKGLGPMVGKIGRKVVDGRISIRDDPLMPEGIYSCPFDDEGVPSRRKHLVEKGVFKGFLTDLKSASKLKVESSGNGFRQKALEKAKSFAAGVGPDISNLIVEAGGMTLDEMRSGTGEAVEIHHLTGILLGDMTNGDFSGNLELAFLLRDGKPAGRIKNAMFSGNFYEIFSGHLAGLGDTLRHTGNFGGGSGWFLPYACLDDVSVAAK